MFSYVQKICIHLAITQSLVLWLVQYNVCNFSPLFYHPFHVQNFLEKTNAKDASGNIVFGDIGVHIQQEVSPST